MALLWSQCLCFVAHKLTGAVILQWPVCLAGLCLLRHTQCNVDSLRMLLVAAAALVLMFISSAFTLLQWPVASE